MKIPLRPAKLNGSNRATPFTPFGRNILAASIATVAVLIGSHAAQAANGPDTWNGATATWSTAGNWTGTNTPPISGDSLVFAAAGAGGVNLNNDLTTAAFNVAGITYNAGAAAFIIGDSTVNPNVGNTFALTGGVTNNGTSLEVINNPFSMTAVQNFTTTAGGGNITLGGNISGAGGGIAALGGGVLTLTGANTFTGGVTLTGGTLNINSAGALGGAAGTFTINAGTTIDNTSGAAVTTGNNPLTINGNFTFTGTNGLNLGTGAVTLGATPTITTTANTLTIGGAIGATANGITKAGAGTLVLGGANAYTGATMVNAGIVQAGVATSAFGIGSAVNVNAAATLDLNGNSNTVGSITGAGNIDNSVAGAVTLTTGSAGSSTFTGTITNSGGGALSLTKVGATSLQLTNSNSYTGNTNLNAGTLLVENSAALGNTALGAVGTLIIAGGTTLGSTTDGVSLANPVTVNGDFTLTTATTGGHNFLLTGPMSLANGIRTITGTTNQGQPQFQGVISDGAGVGAGGIHFTTSGLPAPVGGINSYVAFIMNGTAANTYTGLTTVDTGAFLVFNSAVANKVNGDVLVQGNGVVDFLGDGSGNGLGNGGNNQIASTATVTVNSPGSTIVGPTTFAGFDLVNNSQTIAVLNGSAAGTVGIGAGTLTVSSGNFAGSIVNTSVAPLPAGTPFGGLVKNGLGTLLLSGSSSFSGTTTINAGTLNLTGSFTGTNAITANGTGILTEGVTGVISGASSLTHSSTGTSTLSGMNTYSGATTLNKGSLLVGSTKALGNGSLIVNGGTLQNATLGTSNTPLLLNLGSGNITFNAGTITFIVGGKDGGTLLHDQITTTGKVTGPIGGVIALKQTNGYLLAVGDKVTLVSAAGGVAGGSAGGTAVPAANVSGLSAFSNTSLVPVLNLYTTSIVLEINQGSFLALTKLLSLTPNQQAVAAALDSAAASVNNQTANIPAFQLLNSQSLQSPGSVRVNLELLSPTPLSSALTVGSALSTLQHSNLQHHFDDLRAEAGSATSGESTPTNNTNEPGMQGPEGKGGKDIQPPRHIASTGVEEKERWSAFLVGSGNFTHVGSTSNAAGYNLDTGGVTVGVEYKIAQNLVVGIDAGYANTSTSIANGGSVGVDSGQFGIFATYFDMGYYVDAAIHGGVSGYNTRRTGLGGVATANPGGSSVSFLLAGGYDWKIGALTVGPTASLQHTTTRLDGFTETGSLAPLRVQGHSADSTRTALGVRAFYDVNVAGIALRPELRLAWQHEFGDTTDALTANFAIPTLGGNAFTVNGPQVGRDSLLVGTGVTMIWSNVLSTFIAYDGEVGRSNYDSHSVSGGVRFKF